MDRRSARRPCRKPMPTHEDPVVQDSYRSLLGHPIRVTDISQNIYEGIFTKFYPDLTIEIKETHQVDPANQEGLPDMNTYRPRRVFHAQQIRFIEVRNVNANEIYQSERPRLPDEPRELIPWIGPERSDSDFNIHESSLGNWGPSQMFRVNRIRHGVVSTYDPNLYTVELPRRGTEEYNELLSRANRAIRDNRPNMPGPPRQN